MALKKKQWIIIATVGTVLAIGVIVGVTVGVLVKQKETKPDTVQQRVSDIMEKNPLIDGHNDWAWLIRDNFQNRISSLDLNDMKQYHVKNDTPSHTDIKRLRLGKVGGQFWSIYTNCEHQGKDAVMSFLEQIDLMNRIIEKYPDVFRFVRTVQEARDAFENKHIASFYGVESGQAIESSFALLRLYYQMGVRYMTLTHNCNTPWADQNRVDRVNSTLVKNNGLTEFGKQIIAEMNRLGMLIDLAHVSKKTMLDVLNVTRSPVIFSHSSAYTLCNHTRNVQDDVLQLVKANRGIVMVAFTPGFITCDPNDDGDIPAVARHINYIRNIAGVDSVGLGGDYDGIDRTPKGLEDVSKYPGLIEYLYSSGNWSDVDLIKLIGGNILRVLEENEKNAAEIKKAMSPSEGLIPEEDLKKYNYTGCRYLDMYTTDSPS